MNTLKQPGFDASMLLRRPELVGIAGLVIGLGVGVVVGRETAPVAEDRDDKVSQVKGRLATGKPGKEPLLEAPPQEFRRHLGRDLPRGDDAEGFKPLGLPGRKVAQLTGREATLRFDVDSSGASNYAVTAIVSLTGSKQGTLQPNLDGQALAPASLTEGWGMYYSPVPAALLAKPDHELTLRVDGAAEGSVVAVDSVTMVPVGSEVSLTPGPRGVGAWVEGFSKPAGESVWSEGNRSVVGFVLAPEATDYRLVVRASALARLAPLNVTTKVNGTDVGSATYAKTTTEAKFDVPAKALRAGVNQVEFSYPATARPSEYNAESKDTRALALRFSNIALQPVR